MYAPNLPALRLLSAVCAVSSETLSRDTDLLDKFRAVEGKPKKSDEVRRVRAPFFFFSLCFFFPLLEFRRLLPSSTTTIYS